MPPVDTACPSPFRHPCAGWYAAAGCMSTKPLAPVSDARRWRDRPRIGGSASGYPVQRAQGCRVWVRGRCRSGLGARRPHGRASGRKAGILNKSTARPRYQFNQRLTNFGPPELWHPIVNVSAVYALHPLWMPGRRPTSRAQRSAWAAAALRLPSDAGA